MDIQIFDCVNEGQLTYETEVGQCERVLKVGRGEKTVGFALAAVDHDGVRTNYSMRILEADTVAVIDDRDVAPEALDKVGDLLGSRRWTRARVHVVPEASVGGRVEDALHESERVLLCWEQVGSLHGDGRCVRERSSAVRLRKQTPMPEWVQKGFRQSQLSWTSETWHALEKNWENHVRRQERGNSTLGSESDLTRRFPFSL
jgi:hypothetical protein